MRYRRAARISPPKGCDRRRSVGERGAEGGVKTSLNSSWQDVCRMLGAVGDDGETQSFDDFVRNDDDLEVCEELGRRYHRRTPACRRHGSGEHRERRWRRKRGCPVTSKERLASLST
ncbi:hypothetical protein J6590_107954, partial [Homalodisca vitripennis]